MTETAPEKRWSSRSIPQEEEVMALAKDVNIRPELATLLIQRGINDFYAAKSFFRPNLNELHNPFLMKDMDKAVDRLTQAIEKGESIMVFGDYDEIGRASCRERV